MKKKVKEIPQSYSVKEALSVIGNVSKEAIDDLYAFKEAVEALRSVASKYTHYKDLNKWTDEVYGYVHNMLNKYGFVSGKPEVNATIPDANFWWKMYSVVSNVIYSPHLKSEVSPHHSSAFERNEALLNEIQDILNTLKQ